MGLSDDDGGESDGVESADLMAEEVAAAAAIVENCGVVSAGDGRNATTK